MSSPSIVYLFQPDLTTVRILCSAAQDCLVSEVHESQVNLTCFPLSGHISHSLESSMGKRWKRDIKNLGGKESESQTPYFIHTNYMHLC